MKKITYILLVLLMALSFVACSSASVDVTFPASLFEGSDMSGFDADAYVAENDFEKAVIQEDESILVTMSKSRNDELMKEISDQIKVAFDTIVASEDSSYVKNIEANSDYTEIIVDVVRSEYEGAFDFTPMQIYFSIVFHQIVSGVDAHSEIIMRDVETQEVIKSFKYPDVMQ